MTLGRKNKTNTKMKARILINDLFPDLKKIEKVIK